MAETVEFSGRDTGLAETVRRNTTEAAKLDEAYRGAAREARRLESDARRTFEGVLTPTERYNRTIERLKGHLDSGRLSQETYNRAVADARDRLEEAEHAGESSFGAAALGRLSGFVGGLFSIQQGVSAINRAYDVWIQNERELGERGRTAAQEAISFAALQEPGTRRQRLEQAESLALEYGVTDRALALDTIQAMQSITGSFEEGMAAAGDVFAGKLVGIPVELGKELEIFGATAGRERGDFLRMALVAGQASGRDPEAIARGAPSIQFFDEASFGFAVAAQLAGSVRAEQIDTFVKAAGIGLGRASTAQEEFARAGLADATPLERLRFLRTQGIDTPAELEEFGITEQRQQQALAALVGRAEEVAQTQAEIERRARPGILAEMRASVESDLPEFAAERMVERGRARLAFEGTGDIQAMRETFRQQTLAAELRARGLEQVGFLDLISGEGLQARTTGRQLLFAQGLAGAMRQFGTVGALQEAKQATEEQLRMFDATLEEARRQGDALEVVIEKLDKLINTQQETQTNRRPQVPAVNP